MIIGLHDADMEHLNTKRHKKTFPNYAIMKISAYHKALGDTVEWWEPSKSYDRVYSSKIFDFTPENPLLPGNTIMGGTGYGLFSDLPKEIDEMFPDYSLYPDCDYAIWYITRGCPNNCRWCIVPHKEGAVRPYRTWEQLVRPDSNKLVLMDNNILSLDYGVEQLKSLIDSGYSIDLNQGLDARLVTDSIAAILANLKWIKFIRFSCDSIPQIEAVKNAAALLEKYGVKPYRLFVYLLVTSDLQNAEYRVEQLKTERYKRAQNTITSLWKKAFVKVMLVTRSFDLIELFITIMLYGFAIFRAVSGAMTAGEVVAFVMYFSRIQYAVLGISDIIASILSRAPMWQQLFDFLDIPDEKYKGTIPTEKRDDNEYEFEFKHVYFKYPDSEDYVLKDVNLKWRIGEKMALVGKNGCGKSTLVKLLCRLYDPTEGEITLNGIDIKKYKYEDYMALFSVVFQDSKLFSFSLAENVAADTVYDSECVTDCVIRAGLGERLEAMEKGIETCLYKDFDEKGVEISGGEAQKLCLARAIYKGSPFIVLDEPTAALDPISEHDIYTKFNGIVGTRTAIYGNTAQLPNDNSD